VASAPLGLRASEYRSCSDLKLPDTAIDQPWDDDILAFTKAIRKNLANFDSYPDPAQEAWFDMACLGVGGLLKYHHLLAACDAKDCDRAAKESHRLGISKERNRATAELFLKARTSPYG
jgi:hypothetical protein